MQVPSIEQHNELKAQVEQLIALVKEQQKEIDFLTADIQPWLCQNAARQFFIGRHGKPLTRQTFDKMVNNWIAEHVLVEGENYRKSSTERYINRNFLKAHWNKDKLKVA